MRGTDKVDDVLTVDPTPHAGQAGPLGARKARPGNVGPPKTIVNLLLTV